MSAKDEENISNSKSPRIRFLVYRKYFQFKVTLNKVFEVR